MQYSQKIFNSNPSGNVNNTLIAHSNKVPGVMLGHDRATPYILDFPGKSWLIPVVLMKSLTSLFTHKSVPV